ncbi:hypothetical protein NDU88_006346 [Pleurodeles waltl]|uniref:Uncharacterized protein n=1 Tax=Pleurodeles waltl TaxID=8319 RepID=A0AAV7TE46_PLEWA|nr:hypothetical protein NDU88_006346 [Pleurodeles waltl]
MRRATRTTKHQVLKRLSGRTMNAACYTASCRPLLVFFRHRHHRLRLLLVTAVASPHSQSEGLLQENGASGSAVRRVGRLLGLEQRVPMSGAEARAIGRCGLHLRRAHFL